MANSWEKAGLAGLIALVASLGSTPAQAQTSLEEAHSLRSLDIMLMVTALRCRTGPHDFRADYERFTATHLTRLNAAGDALRHSFVADYGEPGSMRALDRLGVRIANSYGEGHPWMDCADLQHAARELAQLSDPAKLADAARAVLSPVRPVSDYRIADMSAAQIQPPAPVQVQAVRIGYAMTTDWEPGRP